MNWISFLGHMVSGEEVSIDPAIVEGFIGWDQPVNTEDIHRSFRQIGYYLCYIQELFPIASPLTNLIKRGFYFNCEHECEENIFKIKRRLTTTQVLVFSNDAEHFLIGCNASHTSLGCVLMQQGQVVAYGSKQLRS